MREYSIERDAILFHPELQLLCQLNETAYFIWRCCARRSIIELGEFLQNAYAVEASTARQHVLRIIEVFAVNYFVSQESPDAVAC